MTLAVAVPSTFALDKLGAWYRADVAYPEYARIWNESDAGGPDDKERPAPKLGASLHMYLKNTGREPVRVTDVELDGMSLTESLPFSDQRKRKKPASIYFATLTEQQRQKLLAAGEPIWFKIDPPVIEPGGTAEVVVRLRRDPESSASRLAVVHEGGRVEETLAAEKAAPRVASLYFNEKLDTIEACFRRTGGDPAISKVLLDGEDVTAKAKLGSDPACNVSPAVIRLSAPLKAGSFHVVQGVYGDGATAMAGSFAWSNDFVCGMFGGKPGKDGDLSVGRAYVLDLLQHGVNIQMPQIGSGAVQGFYKSDLGKRMCEAANFRHVIPDPGKMGVTKPYAYYIHDEPDAGDYHITGLPPGHQVGSLAMFCLQRRTELREADPVTPQMLNINMTYKPDNWYIYGQVPDIYASDPYYQNRLRTAIWNKPERIPIYEKATYIYGVATVAKTASEPKPMNIILYSNKFVDKPNKREFRPATPLEKRIEAYYTLAAGTNGLSYWWYTPAAPAHGVGGAANDPRLAALWSEIGLINMEARTAGPVLVRDCRAELPAETSSKDLSVHTLLAGLDSMAIIVINEHYTNHETGTDSEPVKDGRISVHVPGWLKDGTLLEVSHGGVRPVPAKVEQGRISVDLGTVPSTRLLIWTTDKSLQGDLSKRYQQLFAANVQRLIGAR